MNWTLEVVVGPVSDVDRAKAFYAKQVGFTVDHDTKVSDEMRVVQLTPRGSGCSMVIGEGIGDMSPGTLQGLQLVVPDLPAARADLIGRGGEGQRDPVARRRFESPRPGRGSARQRRVCFLQRSGRKQLGRTADICPRL